MHVLLLLICVLPRGSASTNASLEGSSDSKSPGHALAVTGSCADVWSQKLCTKRRNDDKCNTKKVRQNCKLTCGGCQSPSPPPSPHSPPSSPPPSPSPLDCTLPHSHNRAGSGRTDAAHILLAY
eukprot:scaffold28965_cov65-Phaeocystis_antarctica.AAC.3